MVLGGKMIAALINDSNVQQQADNRRYELITVGSNLQVPPAFDRFVQSGFIPRGRIILPEGYTLWMFSYVDGYNDDNGDWVDYMPQDQVVLFSSQARCDRYFGPPETMPMTSLNAQWMQEALGVNPNAPMMSANIKGEGSIITPQMFYFDAYESPDRTSVSIRTQTAPIFATTMTDAFVTITDGITPIP